MPASSANSAEGESTLIWMTKSTNDNLLRAYSAICILNGSRLDGKSWIYFGVRAAYQIVLSYVHGASGKFVRKSRKLEFGSSGTRT